MGNCFSGNFNAHGGSASTADRDVITDTTIAARAAIRSAKQIVEHVDQAEAGQADATTGVATIPTRATFIGDDFIAGTALAAVAAKRTTELRQLNLRKRDQRTTTVAATIACAAGATIGDRFAGIDGDFITHFDGHFAARITTGVASASWEQGLQAPEQVAASRITRVASVTGFAGATIGDGFAAYRTPAIEDAGERRDAHQGAHCERKQHNLELHREHSPSLPAESKMKNCSRNRRLLE